MAVIYRVDKKDVHQMQHRDRCARDQIRTVSAAAQDKTSSNGKLM